MVVSICHGCVDMRCLIPSQFLPGTDIFAADDTAGTLAVGAL